MNKKLGIVLVLVAIVAVAMFAGCIEEETPVSTPSPTPTPIPEPKYSPGDIIAEKETANEDFSTIILDYNSKTDEYKTSIIHKVNGKWSHFGDRGEIWEDREFIEEQKLVKIDRVPPSTVMSWEEYWEEEESEKPEWVTIYSFTNSDPWTKWSLTATDCFNIRGNKWRIKYTVEPHGVYVSHEKDSLFKAIVFPRGEDMHSNTALYVSSFECNGQECSDTQYIYEGNGDYYIGVGSKLNIWVLEVEDFY